MNEIPVVCAICENYFYAQSVILATFANGQEFGHYCNFKHRENICITCSVAAHHFNRVFDTAITPKGKTK